MKHHASCGSEYIRTSTAILTQIKHSCTDLTAVACLLSKYLLMSAKQVSDYQLHLLQSLWRDNKPEALV